MGNLSLRLYIAGHTTRSQCAIANLRRICEEHLGGRYDLDVIDVLERPDLAERDRILATPTLIKDLPPPCRRVVGDLADTDRVVAGLNLDLYDPKAGKEGDE
jgi:circadian clock protein KaiB